MTHTRVCLLGLLGNFLQTQSRKENQFHHLTLLLAQEGKGFLDKSAGILWRLSHWRDPCFFAIVSPVIKLLVKIPHSQVVLATETAMIGVLKDPFTKRASGRIKLCRLDIDFEKYGLHQVLSFSQIA